MWSVIFEAKMGEKVTVSLSFKIWCESLRAYPKLAYFNYKNKLHDFIFNNDANALDLFDTSIYQSAPSCFKLKSNNPD